jgi:hypothetical protein
MCSTGPQPASDNPLRVSYINSDSRYLNGELMACLSGDPKRLARPDEVGKHSKSCEAD